MAEKSCLIDLYEFVLNNIFILADAKSEQLDSDYVYDVSSGYGFLLSLVHVWKIILLLYMYRTDWIISLSRYYYSSSLGYYYDPASGLYCSAVSGIW